MLRRLATSVAATSALVLTATGPAFATHNNPEPFKQDTDNLRFCADLLDRGGFEEFQDGLNAHSGWNLDDDANTAVPPDEVDHSWWNVSFEDDDDRNNVFLNVDVEEDVHVIVIVIVKAGSQNTGEPFASNIFVNEPGEDLIGLYAPTVGQADSDKHPTISHYSICKLGNEPDDEETPTPTPTPEPTEPGGMGGGEPTETPAPVPTEIPAGTGSASVGTAGTAGLVAMIAAFAAGAAVIIRRRFLTES